MPLRLETRPIRRSDPSFPSPPRSTSTILATPSRLKLLYGPPANGMGAGDGPRARLRQLEIPGEGLDRRGKAAVQLRGIDVPGRDARQRERPLAGQHGSRVRVQ